MKSINLGMVGSGVHAETILFPSLNYVQNINRVATCDLEPELARKSAKQFGFDKHYTDYHSMIEEEELDGVIICINARKHPEVVIDFLKAGIDVLVEKPAALNPDTARKMLNKSKETNHFIMVDHNKRYSAAFQKMMSFVNEDKFGAPVMLKSQMLGYPYETLFTCMMEWQIHNIDLCRAVGGDIQEVKAFRNQLTEARSAIAIMMRFENGMVGTTHWGTEGGANHGRGAGRGCESLEIVSNNERVVKMENDRQVYYYHRNDARTWESDWSPHTHNQSYVIDGYVGVMNRFVEGVRNNTEPTPNIQDEIKALEFIYEVADQLSIPTDWKVVEGKS